MVGVLWANRLSLTQMNQFVKFISLYFKDRDGNKSTYCSHFHLKVFK